VYVSFEFHTSNTFWRTKTFFLIKKGNWNAMTVNNMLSFKFILNYKKYAILFIKRNIIHHIFHLYEEFIYAVYSILVNYIKYLNIMKRSKSWHDMLTHQSKLRKDTYIEQLIFSTFASFKLLFVRHILANHLNLKM
jgi:hypothetical protein